MTLGSESPSEASRPRWITTSGASVYTMTRWALWKPLPKAVIYWGGTFNSESSMMERRKNKKLNRPKPTRTESWTLEQDGNVIKAWTGSGSSRQIPHPTPSFSRGSWGDTWHFVNINLFSVTWDEGPWSDRCFSLMWFKAIYLFIYFKGTLRSWCSRSSGLFCLKSWAGIFFFSCLMQKGDETENSSSGVGVFF